MSETVISSSMLLNAFLSSGESRPTYNGMYFDTTFLGTGDIDFGIQDLQTSPDGNSTAIITPDASNNWAMPVHVFILAVGLDASAQVALYERAPDGSYTEVAGPVAPPTDDYHWVDMGTVTPDEDSLIYGRIWGPSGGRIAATIAIGRPMEYVAADVVDPTADPTYVTTSGGSVLFAGKDSHFGGYEPWLLVGAPGDHPELTSVLVRSAQTNPDGLSSPLGGSVESSVNGSDVIDGEFLTQIAGHTGGFDTNYEVFGTGEFGGPDIGAVATVGWSLFMADTTPGDVIGLKILGCSEFGGGDIDNPADYRYTPALTSKVYVSPVMEFPGVSCPGGIGRTVEWSLQRSAAIESVEARVYGVPVSGPRVLLATYSGITADPFTFPFGPIRDGFGTYPTFFLAIRSYYYDGSWIQAGCFLDAPDFFATPVFDSGGTHRIDE